MSRSRFSKLVSVVITGVIAISGHPSMVLADVINSPTCYSVQSELDYEITTNITSSWINHESIDLVLTNTGSDTIHNWYLTFNTPYNIENIWNGTIYETDGNGTYTITSNGWNQDIHTGESVTVGITFSSDIEEDLSVDPEWYLLNTQATVVDASQYTLAYTEYSAWETGFTGQLTLTPQVDCQHWELSFASNREITAVSSAVLIPECDNNYAITHDENNMRLLADTAYNFGIQGVNTEDLLEFTAVELTVVDLAYHLSDDVDSNGTPDYLDFIGGGSVVGPSPTPTETPTVSPTDEPTGTPTDEPTGTPAPTEEPTPTVVEDPYYYLEDRDGDKLLDYQEIMYMTDPDNPDTDGDGLLDGDEINIGTSPKLPDTNGNGLIDFDEDFDGDGITNGSEYATGTCMFAYDSDYDGINDYNEVYFYGIDPRNKDTDSDGIKDGDEVTLGLNPGSNDSDGDGITDDYVMFNQSLSIEPIADDHPHEITEVSISGNISGLITSNSTIEDTYNRDMYCTDVYGRIGVPINIESEGHFNTMTLTINYDEGALGDTNEANLGVLWYDENTGFFITQEQAVVDTTNNSITLELSHFSTYVVVDLEMWNNPIIPDYSNYIQIASESDEYWEWGGSVPTLEDREVGCFNWWKLSHPFQLFQIVETLSSNRYCENPNSYVRFWHYEYTWLVMDMTDNDSDGIPDVFEAQGIIGTDGNIYYSDPNLEDTDYDNVFDGDEFGRIYVLHRFNDGALQISLNDVTVFYSEDGSISPDSLYFYFNRFAYNLECNQSLCVATVNSNPKEKDSDGDGYIDSEDARPKTYNPDMVYMLVNIALFDEAQYMLNRYESSGLRVCFNTISDANSFMISWNQIGLHENGLYGELYYYNAKNVVIFTHGSESYLSLGEDDEDTSNYSDLLVTNDFPIDENETGYNVIRIEQLSTKKIRSLCLDACSCGRMMEDANNIAEDFLLVEGIESVFASDTILTYAQGRFFVLGCDYFITITDEEYLQFQNDIQGMDDGIFCEFYDDYRYLENVHGFMLFRESNEPIDVFDDDVYIGVLYTTNSNGYEGYFVCVYDIVAVLGNDHNDPVTDWEGI